MADMATHLAYLVVRQATDNSTTTDADLVGTPGHCDTGNAYDGKMGTRISSIFVILVGSMFGACFPTFAARHRGIGVPEWAFFIAKYFGSGVIIATAFIHLLAPANEALTDGCLTGPITEYSWPEGIALMTIFVLFFVELMVMRYAKFGHSHDIESAARFEPEDALGVKPTKEKIAVHGKHSHSHLHSHTPTPNDHDHASNGSSSASDSRPDYEMSPVATPSCPTHPHVMGDDHLSHARQHVDADDVDSDWDQHQGPEHASHGHISPESYSAQLTAVFILEFGVIFHSVFVGLTLAVSGTEFATLYVVLVFHQTFEGLGLGSRLASIPWPKSKRWTPYFLAAGYAVSTPIAIAIGLGVRQSYPPGSQTTLIVNGVFDSISAGVLIYTGLVELMAHEFMFSNYMQKASIRTVMAAFGTMCAGAGLMALLGKWA